jgi:hypothetical protein
MKLLLTIANSLKVNQNAFYEELRKIKFDSIITDGHIETTNTIKYLLLNDKYNILHYKEIILRTRNTIKETINNSDYVLALWDGKDNSTKKTIDCAYKAKKSVKLITVA